MDLTNKTIEEVVNLLLTCRAKKDDIQNEAKERLAKLEEYLGLLESELRRRKDQDGLDKISTDQATIFWSQRRLVKVTDWDSFFNFAKNYPEMFTKSPAKNAVLEVIDTGTEVPGVTVDGLITMNVRKNTVKD
jgi:hypothetical protein